MEHIKVGNRYFAKGPGSCFTIVKTNPSETTYLWDEDEIHTVITDYIKGWIKSGVITRVFTFKDYYHQL